MNKHQLPICRDTLRKRQAIPMKLAQLSYTKPDAAISFLRLWGEKKIPISPLYEEILTHLESE
ncbi:hypothetical protein [Rossellomorea aquimaris]|uniref:hypothetical protein n=1 Tax=Rossellomorea aquimaris TaxID=189382 RepID=UPI0007D0432C|nr:hypothetical protein [Rossellomorea aquimaris]